MSEFAHPGSFNRVPLCSCGSGKERYALTDAAGIFCRYVCVDCEDKAKKSYNPAIFEGGSRYAASGEEEDIFADDPNDDRCSNPGGHSWVEGEPDRGGEGPIRCEYCGADGDA